MRAPLLALLALSTPPLPDPAPAAPREAARADGLAGVVADGDGRAIPGAVVKLWRPGSLDVDAEARTDEAGRFRFDAPATAGAVVAASAPGRARDLKRVEAGREGDPVEFRLGPGRTLRGKVVDPRDRPVPGAVVAATSWRGRPGLHWRLEADAAGRFSFDEAPEDEVLYDVGKPGAMMWARGLALKATGEEQVVTLKFPVRVRGAVVDARTRRPIESFMVRAGASPGGGPPPAWDPDPAAAGSRGRYEARFSEPSGGRRLRIEATGYRPALSRVIRDDEAEVAVDVELAPGGGAVSGVVRGPDGGPAAGAEVVLVPAPAWIVSPAGAAHALGAGDPADRVRADAAGRFSLVPPEGAYSVVAVHEAGFAERAGAEFEASPEMTLRPWGRVAGTLRVGRNRAGGEAVHVSTLRPGPAIQFTDETTTDADGRFSFRRVPPGDVSVSRYARLGAFSASVQSAVASVRAGETSEVRLGGSGRPVVGRVAPRGEPGPIDWSRALCWLTLDQALPVPPEGLDAAGKAAWHWEFARTEAGAEFRRASRRYGFAIRPDGTFRIEDVAPGAYTLSLTLLPPATPSDCTIKSDPLGVARLPVRVEPPGDPDRPEPCDVGPVGIEVARRLDAGDRAPAFEVPALDGARVRLEDYRGRYVLVDFWATWCGPCVAETPHLKAVRDEFGEDRLALVGLSLDRDAEAPAAYVAKQGLRWAQGFLGEVSPTAEAYGVRSIPSIWLIGPDGRVVARDLRGPGIRDAVKRALGKP